MDILSIQNLPGLVITLLAIIASMAIIKRSKKPRYIILAIVIITSVAIGCIEELYFKQDPTAWFTRAFLIEICTIGYLARTEFEQKKNGEGKHEAAARIQEAR